MSVPDKFLGRVFALEMALLGLFSPRANQSPSTMLTPDSLGALLRELDQVSSVTMVEGRPVPLLAPPSLRVGLRRLIEPVLPNLPVISLAELPPYVKLSAVATWEDVNAMRIAAPRTDGLDAGCRKKIGVIPLTPISLSLGELGPYSRRRARLLRGTVSPRPLWP
jgi:hypothetical protein